MMLRTLVPALGALALTTTPVIGAELAKGLTIGGWVDTILYAGDNGAEDDDATEIKEDGFGLGFTSAASIKVGWQVTDAVTTKINMWYRNDGGLDLREAYFTWGVSPGVSWTMGKYISHVGWTSAEPTGLYRINGGPITSLYGIDVIGTAIAYAPKDSPVSGSFHVVNGYVQGVEGTNAVGIADFTRSTTRENSDVGLGLDLNFNFGKDQADNINLEGFYDMAGNDAGTDEIGGDVAQVGLNATIKSVTDFVFAGEFIYRDVSESEPAASSDASETIGVMLMANYKLETQTPMSVTLMGQYLTNEVDDGLDEESKVTEISLALLTNPLSDANFGLNYELSYDSIEPAGEDDSTDALTFSLEGLIVIP